LDVNFVYDNMILMCIFNEYQFAALTFLERFNAPFLFIVCPPIDRKKSLHRCYQTVTIKCGVNEEAKKVAEPTGLKLMGPLTLSTSCFVKARIMVQLKQCYLISLWYTKAISRICAIHYCQLSIWGTCWVYNSECSQRNMFV